MAALDAEVLGKVDNLHVGRNGVLLQELLALAVTEAEEHHVNLLEGHLCREAQVGFSNQSLMDVTHQITGIALTIGKDNFCLGVVQQQADQLSARIARCT